MPSSEPVPFSLTTGRFVSGIAEVSSSEYPGGLRQPRHGHDAAYFTLVTGGAYDERVGRRSTDVTAGRVIFHPAGEEHAVDFRAPVTQVVRLLPREEMLASAGLLGLDFSRPLDRLDEVQALIARIAREGAGHSADAVLAVDALASEVIGVLAGNGQATRPGAAIAHRTRELIDADPTRRHRLDQLAREAGCHPITLAREFRRATGSSLGTYVRRARLRRACELLRLGELPISMVAATCGFADQAHLTRALRRATGRTPARLSA